MSERFVVVPWVPAALIVPSRERTPDGVDDLVDELFGPDVDENPGWFDAFLLVTGTALFVWSVVSGASAALTVVGAVAGLLGCVLPIRTAWRALHRRGTQRVRRVALARGLPLVADDESTVALIAAYRRVLDAAALPGAALVGEEAVHAAHQAMVEVATLLDGAPPAGSPEQEYVSQRTRALGKVAVALERHHEFEAAAQARGEAEGAEVAEAERRLEAAARLAATQELDARLGPMSLDRLDILTRGLEPGPGALDH